MKTQSNQAGETRGGPLTKARILATAVALADREGIGAVTLRRIASELNVHVTSLYNHIPTRDAVTDGMVDALIEEAGLPLEPMGWEDWTRAFVRSIQRIAEAHPGAFAALQLRPVQGPRTAASFEVGLSALREAGFTSEETYGAVKTAAFVALSIGLEQALLARGERTETDLSALPVEGFPEVHAAEAPPDPQVTWDFAVDALIAGIKAKLSH